MKIYVFNFEMEINLFKLNLKKQPSLENSLDIQKPSCKA